MSCKFLCNLLFGEFGTVAVVLYTENQLSSSCTRHIYEHMHVGRFHCNVFTMTSFILTAIAGTILSVKIVLTAMQKSVRQDEKLLCSN